MTIESLEAELAELQAAYEQVCDELRMLKAQAPSAPITTPAIVSRQMPARTTLCEYLPCAKTGRLWARVGKTLHEARTCATVDMPDGRTLAFRKWAHAQAWLDAGMPEFVSEW